MRRKRDVRDRDLCKDQCSPPGNNKAMGACKCAWGHEREREGDGGMERRGSSCWQGQIVFPPKF